MPINLPFSPRDTLLFNLCGLGGGGQAFGSGVNHLAFLKPRCQAWGMKGEDLSYLFITGVKAQTIKID